MEIKSIKKRDRKISKKDSKKNKSIKTQYIIIISIIVGLLIAGILVFLAIKDNTKKPKEIDVCVLQYNVNGGNQINSFDTECGTKIDEPVPPEKEGFNFVGWFIENEKVDFDNFYLSKNTTIEAKWEAKENIQIIIVKFDTKGGNNIDGIEIVKGAKLTPPLEPKKEGYVFKYWSYNDKRFDFMTDINENIILVAVWEKENKNNSNSSNNSNSNSNSNNNNSTSSSSTIEKCTYEIKDLESEYNGKVPEWIVGLDEKHQFSSYSGFWSYNYNGCNIVYKTENSSIAPVSSTGVITGKKLGSTYVNICVVDKTSNKELDCFKWKINVQYEPGSKRAKTDATSLLNAIDGYYWYLDGYSYAYIHPVVKDWYDHQVLSWDSKYIEIKNNKFVTTEDTDELYLYSSANIHNKFSSNPKEYAYLLIQDYNMHVSNNKLYITLGGKTYSFTKSVSEKSVIGKITLNQTSYSVNKKSSFTIDVSISPRFAKYNLDITSSDTDIVSCWVSDGQINSGKSTVHCFTEDPGTATLKIKDTKGGNSKTVNITVNNNPIKVTSVSLNKTEISLLRGESEKITAKVNPSTADNKSVTWSSSDTNVATVDSKGTVKAVGKGTATITVKTSDGGYTATVKVSVSNPSLTANGSIGISTIASSSGITRGVFAEVNASGGTGTYTYYYIKLYKDGTLIGTTTNTSSNELFISGYSNGRYTMEYEVRDSDGTVKKGTSSSTISGF